MQTFIGRLTHDATIRETKDGRNVVQFSLAQNRRFKRKGSDQVEEQTTYFESSYWASTGIVPYLKKGTLVQVTGFVGINVWNNDKGEARGALTLHAHFIELLASPKDNSHPEADTDSPASDDLPF